MKKYIYGIVALLTFSLCVAQPVTLNQAEYFWDTDPGEGNGTAITAVDGNFNSAFEKINLTGLNAPSVGLHKFSIRVKDNLGVWGPIFTNIIAVEPTTPTPITLTQAEYFWDTDPGEGSATPLLAVDGNFNSAFEKVAIAGLDAPSVGIHKFSIRVKDSQGVWGPAFTSVITVEQTTTTIPVSLFQAEYFWDNDPGEGSGTPLLATDGNFNNAFEQIFNTTIPIVNPTGLHVFNVRIKDNQGIWGPVFKNVIYIETVLGSEEFSISKIIVYPNPVKDILNISLDKEITVVSIYNLLGQEVMIKSVNSNQTLMDISNLSAGTYLVKVASGNEVKTVKVVKN
ncbi:T9SS type A sorting domain-containing protein [Flavobacterium sp.]|uniref:T9SS type A sorting domain-containing protein n=1 Tax=Flavobacterium sp. TaxID=239 RepID=UPI002619230C|nr:T9SS type A sorting domain-containing protein [Flavobacterium sp.]